MLTTPMQHPGQTASGRHSAQQQRPESRPPTPVTAPPSPATCSALLPPVCCLLLVLSLLRNPRPAWARPLNAARALTRARLLHAGPSRHRHVAHRGWYPLQETPRHPLEPQGRRRDLHKARTSPKTTATPGAMLFSDTQCTFYSSHPLRTPDSGRKR